MITRMAKNENIMKRKIEREKVTDELMHENKIEEFKFWLNKVADKNDIVEVIRYYGANYGECYKMMNILTRFLEEK
jgi:hypothetical protein